jgi:hypothetical protein
VRANLYLVVATRRFKYDFFPSMFNTADLTWYPPDYRRAVVPDQDEADDAPLPTSIMLTPLESPPPHADSTLRQQLQL